MAEFITEEPNFKITIESKNPIINEVFEFNLSRDKVYQQCINRIKSLMRMRGQILGTYASSAMVRWNQKSKFEMDSKDKPKNKSVYDMQAEAEGSGL